MLFDSLGWGDDVEEKALVLRGRKMKKGGICGWPGTFGDFGRWGSVRG